MATFLSALLPPPPPLRAQCRHACALKRGWRLQRCAAVVLLALLLSTPCAVLAQQDQPLAGAGEEPPPGSAVTQVFVSVFVDRLLEISTDLYSFTAVVLFYLSWTDPRAKLIIADNRKKIQAGNMTCDHPCYSMRRVSTFGCCDGVWRPHLNTANIKILDSNRVVRYAQGVDPATDSVFWWTETMGTWYTPMDFRAFPFDKQRLRIQLESIVPQTRDGTVVQGLELIPSAAGESLFSFKGVGDDLSNWRIDRVLLTKASYPACAAFAASFSEPSNTNDPAPVVPPFIAKLATTPGASPHSCGAALFQTRIPPVGSPFVRRGGAGDSVLSSGSRSNTAVTATLTSVGVNVDIYVARLYVRYIVSAIFPTVMCTWMAFLVFLLPRTDLEPRLSTVVTLFLALAAIAFVVDAGTPASSYATAMQQLTMASYIAVSLVAMESVVIWWASNLHAQYEAEAFNNRNAKAAETSAAAAAAVAASGFRFSSGAGDAGNGQEQEGSGSRAGAGGHQQPFEPVEAKDSTAGAYRGGLTGPAAHRPSSRGCFSFSDDGTGTAAPTGTRRLSRSASFLVAPLVGLREKPEGAESFARTLNKYACVTQ